MSEPELRVLATAPDLARVGGVSSYLAALKPHLAPVADYFTTGRRFDRTRGAAVCLQLLADYVRFLRALLRSRYDLVHINAAFDYKALMRDAVFVAIAKLAGRRVLVFLHGWEYARDRALWTGLLRRMYFRADGMIVLASETTRRLRDLGYTGPIIQESTVAPVPVPARPERRRARDNWRILFLARLEKTKGLYEAIDAYAIVRRRHQNAELVIAGTGGEEGGAREYVRNRAIPGVTFLGYVTGAAKTELFESAGVYLLPTYAEGLPGSLLEAMSHGLPVVARAAGGIADFFEDRLMGRATDSLDPKVLAGMLESVFEDPDLAAAMGSFNREFARRWFAPDRVAARLKEIYQQVACGDGPRDSAWFQAVDEIRGAGTNAGVAGWKACSTCHE